MKREIQGASADVRAQVRRVQREIPLLRAMKLHGHWHGIIRILIRFSVFIRPIALLPTLGVLDLHLWSEGSRERAWERLALVNARSRAFRALRSPYGRRTPPVSASSGFQWDRSKHFERERHCSHAYCAHKKTATSPASGFYRCLQLFAGRVNRLSTRSIGRFSTPRGSLWRQQQGPRPGVYSRIRQLRTVSILTDARATTTRSRMARGTKRGMMAEYS
jgi:hypothetical protein